MDKGYATSIQREYLNVIHLYREFNDIIENKIRNILKQEDIVVSSIYSRVKTENSLLRKINKKQNKYTCLGNITDISGIRIITYYSDEIDKIARIIEKEFDVDWENSIDKRTMLDPDRFGYLSLHYVVKLSKKAMAAEAYQRFSECKAEIQLRSILQHAWAEIEHDSGYKSSINVPKEIRRDFYRLAGLLELADKEFISIRDKISNYSRQVSLQISEAPNSVLLDVVSLKSYIQTSMLLSELNQRIANIVGAVIIENDESLSGTVNELNFIRINTIKDIDDLILVHRDLAVRIAEKMFEDNKYAQLSQTIGLFYLCYAVLVIEGSADNICKYLEDNNIGSGDKMESAKKLLNIFEDLRSI